MEKEITIAVSIARAYLDGDNLGDDFDLALDNAQGEVFSGDTHKATIILNIVPDPE